MCLGRVILAWWLDPNSGSGALGGQDILIHLKVELVGWVCPNFSSIGEDPRARGVHEALGGGPRFTCNRGLNLTEAGEIYPLRTSCSSLLWSEPHKRA